MLYPNFDELVQLRSKAAKGKLPFKHKVKSPASGDYLSSFRGHGMEFDEVRQYIIGDDIRKIDWRITAKIGKPHIKLFKEERMLNLLLCVDMNKTMQFGTRSTFKSVQAARCAAILGWCANSNGDNVGACLFGNSLEKEIFLRPKRSRSSIWQMLKALSHTKKKTDNNLCIPLSQPIEFLYKTTQSGSVVFIISDFMNIDDNFQQQLCYLARRCKVVLISVNDPSDMNIISAGNIVFASNSQQKIHIATDDKNGQKSYHQEWENNRKRLKQITNDLGINIISISTDRDAYHDLFLGLR